MRKKIKGVYFLVLAVFLSGFSLAAVVQMSFNSPDDGQVSLNNFRVLNITVNSNDSTKGMDLIIYGSNDSIVQNNSIIFRRANASNGTNIAYNWSSPKLRASDESNTVLIMYFDNQSVESANNRSVDAGMALLYRMDNASVNGEGNSLVFDYSNSRNNGSVINWANPNASGRFFGAYQFNSNNYIDSGSPGSLNISNGLSIEGWFYPFGNGRKAGNITQANISRLQFDSDTGTVPDIVQVSGETYAIAYQGAGSDGFVATVNISANGSLSGVTDILEFDTSSGIDPKIIRVAHEIYAIVYEGPSGDGFAATVNITDRGEISNTIVDSYEFDTSDGNNPDIINVFGNIYAIAYEGNGAATGTDETFLIAINISSNGTIFENKLSSYEFEADEGINPEIINVNDSVYAIVYDGPSSDGYIATVNISRNGTIGQSLLSRYSFDGGGVVNNPEIIPVSGDVYAIAYEGTGGDGFVVTANISSNGSVVQNVIDSLEFDTANGNTPAIAYISGDMYAVAYDGTSADGFIKSVQISSGGVITDSVADSYEFDTSDGNTPRILHIAGDTYAIAYEGDGGGGNEGFLITLDIATDMGISKPRSFNLYANTTTASGSINTQTVSGAVVSGWNHIALVYNHSLTGNQQNLYINGKLSASGNLNKPIGSNILNLTIGNNFEGLIDDAVVYNRTLSPEEIAEHAGLKILDEKGLNNGTGIYNNDNYNYSGRLGGALVFDGIEEVLSINDSSSLDLTNDFSVSFWAEPTTLSRNMTFISKGSGTTANYFIDYKATNQIEFGFYNGAFRSILVDASSVSANAWNLITATWNESSNMSRVYINGAEKGSLQINSDMLSNSLPLKIGYYPGYNQNFTGMIDELVIYNKTLNVSEISNIYSLKAQNWYWKFSAQDYNGLNMSSTRSFLIGSVWGVSPSTLGSISAALDVNVSAGIITINNTHPAKNITINITHDHNRSVVFNHSFPFTLYNTNNGSNTLRVQINVTTPTTDGSRVINFNISANDTNAGGESVPSSVNVPITVVSTSSNPFLISAFEDAPSVVSQNNTGIQVKASVVNRGQGIAQNVLASFLLPSGWSNTSGALNQSLGVLAVNEQKNASITVSISSNATSGNVVLYTNLSGQNSSGADLTSGYFTIGSANVTVNAVSVGAGPSVEPVEIVSSSSSGGGGSGSKASEGKGGGSESLIFSKEIEIVRGKQDSFYVEILNRFANSSLQNITLEIRGYPKQYIEIFPEKIDILDHNKKASFRVKLTAPIYKDYEVYVLKAIIRGKLETSNAIKDYLEVQNIKLTIQAAPLEETKGLLEKAKSAVQEMKNNGFNAKQAELLLKEAEKKLSERKNKEAIDLANKIISIKDVAFRANALIEKIKGVIGDPRKIQYIAGAVVSDGVITGYAVIETEEAQEVLNLAIIAFERGDYYAALERAEAARLLLVLEGKSNFKLFFYLYWHYILITIVLISVFSIVSYHSHQKSSLTNRIEELNFEEERIGKLAIEAQKEYYSGKMGEREYKEKAGQFMKKVASIQKERLSLRNKRIRMLPSETIIQDLEREAKQIENLIRKIQYDYFRDRKINEPEYKEQFTSLSERLAEIEEERATLELRRVKRQKTEVAKPDKKEVKTIAESLIGKGNKDIVIIEHKFIDKIKSLLGGRDVKGKWIKINLEKSEAARRLMEERE